MRYIGRMDLSESTKLPSELTIAQNLGVSRITVCRVLGDLEQTRRLLDRQKSQDCDELTIACNSYMSTQEMFFTYMSTRPQLRLKQ